MPNLERIGQKLLSLEGVKVFHKTGSRKILKQPIGPKLGTTSQDITADVPAKFHQNRMWKI